MKDLIDDKPSAERPGLCSDSADSKIANECWGQLDKPEPQQSPKRIPQELLIDYLFFPEFMSESDKARIAMDFDPRLLEASRAKMAAEIDLKQLERAKAKMAAEPKIVGEVSEKQEETVGEQSRLQSGEDSGARSFPNLTIIDNPEEKSEATHLIPHNPERIELSTLIINDILSGGTAEIYKEQIADLSSSDRLALAKDLHATASEYNQLRELTPGVDRDALVVDVRVGKEDEYVNDIDIMRGFSSKDEPERVMERIDLYDPGFWTGLRKEGREVDQKQALDAITAPYEIISKLKREYRIAEWRDRAADSPNLRRWRDESIDGSWLSAENVMEKDHLNYLEQEKYEPLKENLEANSKNPGSVLLTENTKPLFPESSSIARNELRPSEKAEELISDLLRSKSNSSFWRH